MQTISEQSDKTKSLHILSFEEVELTKSKAGTSTFIDIGTLHVLFFPEYNRFVLSLNGWGYALLKRLPVTASIAIDSGSNYYSFPVYDGLYNLKISKVASQAALKNFETILEYNSRLTHKSEDKPVRENDVSLDDVLPETFEGLDDLIDEPSVDISLEGRVDPEGLNSTDKIKRGFARFADKISRTFGKSAAGNINFTEIRDINSIRMTTDSMTDSQEMSKESVERLIMRGKHLARRLKYGAFDIIPTQTGPISTIEEQPIVPQVVMDNIPAHSGPVTMDVHTTDVPIVATSTNIVVDEHQTMSKSEMDIIREIEHERQLQEAERRKQDEHKQRELDHIERERALEDAMKRKQEETQLNEMYFKEQILKQEINVMEQKIEDYERQRQAKRHAHEETEKALIREMEGRLAELRAKDMMSEEEHAEFMRREQELLKMNERKERERLEAQRREGELLAYVVDRGIELSEREKLSDEQRDRLLHKETEMRLKIASRLMELSEKERLTEEEYLELQEKEQELIRLTQIKEAERRALQREKENLEKEAERRLAELGQKELLTEMERQELIMREQELEKAAQKKLAELRMKEKLTEAEHLELLRREQELLEQTRVQKAKIMELGKQEEQLEKDMLARQIDLQEKERLTYAEMEELKSIRDQLLMATELKDAERRELELRRNQLIREAEQRAADLKLREEMTEVELAELEARERQLEKEIEIRLAELKEKERLTEEERLEVRRKEEKLLRFVRIREFEAKRLLQLTKHENRLLSENERMIEGLSQMQLEMEKIQFELSQPINYIANQTAENLRVAESDLARSQHKEKDVVIGSQETTYI